MKTKSGEEIAGVLSEKGETKWTITTPNGKSRQVEAAEIETHSVVTTMPPMGAILEPEEIRDIVSYLAELK